MFSNELSTSDSNPSALFDALTDLHKLVNNDNTSIFSYMGRVGQTELDTNSFEKSLLEDPSLTFLRKRRRLNVDKVGGKLDKGLDPIRHSCEQPLLLTEQTKSEGGTGEDNETKKWMFIHTNVLFSNYDAILNQLWIATVKHYMCKKGEKDQDKMIKDIGLYFEGIHSISLYLEEDICDKIISEFLCNRMNTLSDLKRNEIKSELLNLKDELFKQSFAFELKLHNQMRLFLKTLKQSNMRWNVAFIHKDSRSTLNTILTEFGLNGLSLHCICSPNITCFEFPYRQLYKQALTRTFCGGPCNECLESKICPILIDLQSTNTHKCFICGAYFRVSNDPDFMGPETTKEQVIRNFYHLFDEIWMAHLIHLLFLLKRNALPLECIAKLDNQFLQSSLYYCQCCVIDNKHKVTIHPKSGLLTIKRGMCFLKNDKVRFMKKNGVVVNGTIQSLFVKTIDDSEEVVLLRVAPTEKNSSNSFELKRVFQLYKLLC
ncbi:hypothetical protein RFI_05568 [Reticulomyxa filosa]|uniref:Uncharacterized protein n=1 Tax=Reticulomyxa filosa TaxID=46433 RepID=X6P0E6_RETFI|nr:hypothetical protein RFI_05568 [Reticulomyxa filosa]|eukprot:ETO31549.1 hypothetical protein RFI_05568 [Reticulomyxa filosa]